MPRFSEWQLVVHDGATIQIDDGPELPLMPPGAYLQRFPADMPRKCRYRTIREEWDDEPGMSAHNPAGLPERTVVEYEIVIGPA